MVARTSAAEGTARSMDVAITRPPSRAVTRAADGFARRAFTVDDISKMMDAGLLGSEERFELIEGDIVMSSAQHIGHERIKHALNFALVKAAGEEVYVAVASALQLADDVLIVPDLAVVSRSVYAADPKSFARPRAKDVRLMIEIATGTLAYDRKIKARLYARHGISEFWLIDADERVAHVHRGPHGDHWEVVDERGPDDKLTTPVIPSFAFMLAQA
jgi:Uma2 family endonuclease